MTKNWKKETKWKFEWHCDILPKHWQKDIKCHCGIFSKLGTKLTGRQQRIRINSWDEKIEEEMYLEENLKMERKGTEKKNEKENNEYQQRKKKDEIEKKEKTVQKFLKSNLYDL